MVIDLLKNEQTASAVDDVRFLFSSLEKVKRFFFAAFDQKYRLTDQHPFN
jgi:hypothetical protein